MLFSQWEIHQTWGIYWDFALAGLKQIQQQTEFDLQSNDLSGIGYWMVDLKGALSQKLVQGRFAERSYVDR